jgi:hypothetical protein
MFNIRSPECSTGDEFMWDVTSVRTFLLSPPALGLNKWGASSSGSTVRAQRLAVEPHDARWSEPATVTIA